MNRSRRVGALLADPTWRYPIVFGLLTMPATVGQFVRGDVSVDLSWLVLAALFAGYVAGTQPGRGKRVGARTVLIGAVPLPFLVADTLYGFATTSSTAWSGVGKVLVVGFFSTAIVAMLGVLVVLGMLAAKLGSWVAERTGRRQDPPVSAA